MSSNMFGVYDELSNSNGGDTQHSTNEPFSGIFDNLDNGDWFGNFKMETLTDSMILDAMRPVTDSAPMSTQATATIPKSDGEYAELHNLQQPAMQHQSMDGHPQRDDDGYGSQTIYAPGLMNSPTANDDDFGPFTRERCHTWPSVQRNADDDRQAMGNGQQGMASYQQRRYHHRGQFSPTGLPSRGSSGLSLITESNESVSTMHQSRGPMPIVDNQRTAGQWLVTPANLDDRSRDAAIKSVLLGGGSGSVTRHSSGSDTSEPGVKQQQQPTMTTPMATGNYKAGHPSYVELITQAINSSPEKRMTLSEIYDWMVANVPAFKDQRYLHSSSGWKNSVRHNLSLHSRFKRVKRNGMDKPSWWTVDLTEEIKRERTSKRNPKAASRPRANTTTAVIYHPPQHIKTSRGSTLIDSGNASRPQHSSQILLQQGSQVNTIGASSHGGIETKSAQQMTKTTTLMGTPTLGVLQEGGERMEWAQITKQATTVDAGKVNNVSQAITVTLCDAALDGVNGNAKPDIALTITVGDESQNPNLPVVLSANGGGSMTHLVQQFRQNTLEELSGRQVLRVKTSTGYIQEVSVPIPMPIRVVTRANKDCQTEPMSAAVSVSTLCSGVWSDTEKQDQMITTLEELVGIGEIDQQLVEQQQSAMRSMMGQPLQQQQMLNAVCGQLVQDQTSGALSPSEMLNSYFQPTEVQPLVNGSQKNPSAEMAAGASLPDDLVGVDVRDSFDCNIMDILSSFDVGTHMANNAAGFN